jgi:SMC interacting uncharacterized protein involved in chromosome segregation
MDKVRAELSERVAERSEEVKVLRSLMDNDHKSIDNFLKETEGLRNELRQKTELLERLRTEAAARDEELKLLRKSHDTCLELKETLRKEEVEKIQLGRAWLPECANNDYQVRCL